jgi:glycine cleavage system transcriptional repressor
VFFRPLEGEPLSYRSREHAVAFELQVVGVDKAGIVANVARCLADHRINISQMATQSRPEPETGTPIFTMRITMDVPSAVDLTALRQRLDEIAARLHVDLTLRPG